jgi:hypothetical protein
MFGTLAVVLAMALPQVAAGVEAKVKSDVSEEVAQSQLGGMWYEGFADPDGAIESCQVLVAVGDAAAAAKVCDQMVGRRVTPARDAASHKAYGYFLGSLSFSADVPQMPAGVLQSDVTIAAKGLPGGQGARVGIAVNVDSAGKVIACDSGDESALGKVACQQASTMDMPIGKSKKGETVAYLRPMIVEFQPDPG